MPERVWLIDAQPSIRQTPEERRAKRIIANIGEYPGFFCRFFRILSDFLRFHLVFHDCGFASSGAGNTLPNNRFFTFSNWAGSCARFSASRSELLANCVSAASAALNSNLREGIGERQYRLDGEVSVLPSADRLGIREKFREMK